MWPCLGIRVPGFGVAVIEVIVWLRFLRSVSAQLGVSMPVPLIGTGGQHVVGKLIASAPWALVDRCLTQLGGLVYVLF